MKLKSSSMAPMSALVGVENFIIDKTNIRIIINLILYAFEDEKIMNIMKGHISSMRKFYDRIIIKEKGKSSSGQQHEIDRKYLSRVVQTVVNLYRCS